MEENTCDVHVVLDGKSATIQCGQKNASAVLGYHIARLLANRGHCSWTPCLIQIADPYSLAVSGVTYRHSITEAEDLRRILINSPKTCIVTVIPNMQSPEMCELCATTDIRQVGFSKQIYRCPHGHIGFSRHPGEDDTIHWYAFADILAGYSGTALAHSSKNIYVWNEINVCLSEANLDTCPENRKLWRLTCEDVLTFERDFVLIVLFHSWKSAITLL